jgi:hypothetical protein
VYKEGAFAKLAAISGARDNNDPNNTPEEQYKKIKALDPRFLEYMKYDSSGQKIKAGDYAAMVQAFWDKMDADKEEMQSIHDSIESNSEK